MTKQKLTFFQTFNAMRIYLTSYFKKTNAPDIAILLSGLKLDSSRPNWKENLWTWDQAMFEDWMDGVNKTLQDLNKKLSFFDLNFNFLANGSVNEVFTFAPSSLSS